MPGLVDVHCHGALGGSFDDDDDDEAAVRAAVAFHARAGSTTLIASLISAPAPVLMRRLRRLVQLATEGVIAGIHLEGPYLSPARAGVHAVDVLRDPDPGELHRFFEAADGHLRMITLAPERRGAAPAIELIRRCGAVAAIGHTDASAAQCTAAVDAGATMATHLWNGMRPLQHRAGGPVSALLADERVYCELIADGEHLADDVLTLSLRVLGPQRAVLVSDASASTGCADGAYRLGATDITVTNGVARTSGTHVLAGSMSTAMDGVRRLVRLGVDVAQAVRAASANPAQAVDLAGVGELRVGGRADLVRTDFDLRVEGVMRAGVWL
jgi:N-acetylglucosamine-6-phosphate deacetylase